VVREIAGLLHGLRDAVGVVFVDFYYVLEDFLQVCEIDWAYAVGDSSVRF
jgi:hypothetical protein